MKIKNGFVLHSVGDENVVVAIGKMTKKFRGMIRLNSTGAFIFRQLEKETDEKGIIDALIAEYGIDEQTATTATTTFVSQLKDAGVLDI
ncbi:MAG: PqqD family protein [Ruminococcaceae bacterium]|nr:PqqD family protein [Oscillospiraceae bacterium]